MESRLIEWPPNTAAPSLAKIPPDGHSVASERISRSWVTSA